MNLHLNGILLGELLEFAAKHHQINTSLVEKDYWVTYLLKQVYLTDLRNYTYFKGGTSLSKAYGLINRFSEDIDLLVYSNNPFASKQTEKNIAKELAHLLYQVPSLQYQKSLSTIGGIYKKLLFDYPQYSSTMGLKDQVEVEITCIDHNEKEQMYLPTEVTKISTFIYQYLLHIGRIDLIQQFDMFPIEVLTVQPEKTLCDKICRLARISYHADAVNLIAKYNRDLYDINAMLKQDRFRFYVQSDNFVQHIDKVIKEDSQFKKTNFNKPFYCTPLFQTPESVLNLLPVKQALQETQRFLVFDQKVDVPEMVETMRFLYSRFTCH